MFRVLGTFAAVNPLKLVQFYAISLYIQINMKLPETENCKKINMKLLNYCLISTKKVK